LLTLLKNGNISFSRNAALASAAVLFTGFAISLTASNILFLLPAIAIAFMLPFVHQVVAVRKPAFMSALVSAGVPLFVGLPLILLLHSAYLTGYFQPYILLGILLLTWTYDTFAFLVGSWLGKTKLLEHVSPKKSLEGLAGGAIFALFGAWIYSQYNTDLTFYNWLIITGIVVIFGTLGDLCESVLKRNFNAKDSGSIMPGHGGILDRFDALLFTGPVVFSYLLFVVK
jgi:phosphatidate cytidylyltransferase